MSEEKNLAQILHAVRMHYIADLLHTKLSQERLMVTLSGPAMLTAALRGMGNRERAMAFVGGECFRMIAATSVGKNGTDAQLRVRLVPNDISDVLYLEADPYEEPQTMYVHPAILGKGAFSVPFKTFIERHLLNVIEPTTGKTNEQLIAMILEAEKKRFNKGFLESHEHFGEW